MRWRRSKRRMIKDEYEELQVLLHNLKEAWDNYDKYLNSLEDAMLIEEWTYKVLIQKQLYRYVLRLVREYYEGGGIEKHVHHSNGDTNFDRPI